MNNKFYTILICLSFTTSIAFGQIRQVSVGAGYSFQAYFNLADGKSTGIENTAWDIAFSNVGFQDAGVFINESAASSEEPVRLWLSDLNNWDEAITDFTIFTDSLRLYNAETSWDEGAFNSVKDASNPFDYGWGEYNPSSHQVEGKKIYVMQKRDGSYIKLQVQQFAGGAYTFRYANPDNSEEKTVTISKADAAPNSIICFSFDTEDIIAMPTEYDLIFSRYTTPLDAGDSTYLEYMVTGILLAPGTEAVVADGVDPLLVSEEDYADDYSSDPTIIGHEWKSFDFSAGWIVEEDRTQFIKTSNGDIYQLTIYDFEGSSTGITTFETSFIGNSTSINEVSLEELGIQVYPNPASYFLNVDSDTDMIISLFDQSGQLLLNKKLETGRQQINLDQIPQGYYNVLIYANDQLISKPLIITK